METSVAIIGLGSRGLSVLERIVTLGRTAGPVRVDVIDPTCAGAGIHSTDQPDYLLLNTTCAQVSMFPDALSVGSDSGEPGPSLYEWGTERGLRLGDDGFTVGDVGRPIRPTDFLPRRVLGEYLGWFRDEVVRRAPRHVQIALHRATAIDLECRRDGYSVALSNGSRVDARHVFLTTGYTGNRPDGANGPLVPDPDPLPEQVADIAPGQSVAIGGFGLSAMDVMCALTVGRGGQYVKHDGELRYVPSGREPAMIFYSRSGLPCRARPLVVEFGPKYDPVVFTEAGIDAVRVARGGPLDFDRDLMPLILTEMRIAYRRCEARCAGGVDAEQDLVARLRNATDIGAVLAGLDEATVPFDAAAAFNGSPGMLLDDGETYQKWLADIIERDLAEGILGFTRSPVKAALDILRDLRDTLRYAVDFGGLTPSSLEVFHRRTVPMINRAVVGPQYERHLELLALMAAGIAGAPFGPEPAVTANGRRWTIRSTRLGVPNEQDADWLIAAQVDQPGVAATASPLLAALHRRGLIRPHRPGSRQVPGIDVSRDQHPIAADGRPMARIWVLGPLCEGATYYNNLVPSPHVCSRPLHDAHRCVAAMFAGTQSS